MKTELIMANHIEKLIKENKELERSLKHFLDTFADTLVKQGKKIAYLKTELKKQTNGENKNV